VAAESVAAVEKYVGPAATPEHVSPKVRQAIRLVSWKTECDETAARNRNVGVRGESLRASGTEGTVESHQLEEPIVKTDELIKMLATNIEPVKDGEFANPLLISLAVAVGTVASICLLWAGMIYAPQRTRRGLGRHGDRTDVHSGSGGGRREYVV